MSDAAFVQAILERPNDDTLRLIYADWLEERGDPRGEFIRVQIELADPALNGLRRKNLLVRQHELLAAHQPAWLGLLRELPIVAEFQRGFPFKVSLVAKVFLDHAETLFRIGTLRSVRLRRANDTIAQLAHCPHLRRLSSLDLSENDLDDTAVEVLADSPHLGSLHSLLLATNMIGMGSAALAGSRRLASLAVLDLSHNAIEALGLHALLHSSLGLRLQSLGVAHCGIHGSGTRYLTEASLEQLTWLNLGRNPLGHPGLAALTRAARPSALTTLCLDDTDCDCRGARHLAAAPFLARLQTLSLRKNHINGFGAEVLATAPHLAALTELDLRQNPIPPAARQKLRGRFGPGVFLDDSPAS